MALGNCTRLRNKNLCTLETSVCIICHSVVSHLQGDAQTQLHRVYIHSDLYTRELLGTDSKQNR